MEEKKDVTMLVAEMTRETFDFCRLSNCRRYLQAREFLEEIYPVL